MNVYVVFGFKENEVSDIEVFGNAADAASAIRRLDWAESMAASLESGAIRNESDGLKKKSPDGSFTLSVGLFRVGGSLSC